MSDYFNEATPKRLLEEITNTHFSSEYAQNETLNLLKKYRVLNDTQKIFYEKTGISTASYYRIRQGIRLSKRIIIIICLAYRFEYKDSLFFLALHERELRYTSAKDRIYNSLLQRASTDTSIDWLLFADEYLSINKFEKLTK